MDQYNNGSGQSNNGGGEVDFLGGMGRGQKKYIFIMAVSFYAFDL